MSEKDCPVCFVKDCECECNTCKSARKRNSGLSYSELNQLNIASATSANESEKK